MNLIAFVPTTEPTRARAFYQDILGLHFVSQDSFAVVLDANGTSVRVANVSSVTGFTPVAFTILGWQVPDLEQTVRRLQEKGVGCERYEGMEQDALGIWSSPSGAKVAWFKDPDGNVLSVTEH